MGVSSGGNDFDLNAAMIGGTAFEARLNELSKAKQSLENAYTNLGLGNNAKVVMEKASALKLEAEALLEKNTALSETIISKANNAALKIANDARAKSDAVRSEAAEYEKNAKTKSDGLVSEASIMHSKALSDAGLASAKLADVIRREAAVASREIELENRLVSHNADHALLKNIILELKRAIEVAVK